MPSRAAWTEPSQANDTTQQPCETTLPAVTHFVTSAKRLSLALLSVAVVSTAVAQTPITRGIPALPQYPLAPQASMVMPEHKMSEEIKSKYGKDKKVKDKDGRQLYTIFIRSEALSKHKGKAPPKDKFNDFQKAEHRHVVDEYKTKYGFEPINMASVGGAWVDAYLDDKTAKKLANDSQVYDMKEILDERGGFSASAVAPTPWSDFGLNAGETISWGVQAVRAADPPPPIPANKQFDVYMIDSGPAEHVDLGSVQRLYPSWRLGTEKVNPTAVNSEGLYLDPEVGCYPHGMHVAGIIAGSANSAGARGVFPGLPIDSIRVTANTLGGGDRHCAPNEITPTDLANGIQFVRDRIQARGRVGIINLSQNSQTDFTVSGDASAPRLGNRIKDLVTATASYKGALLVQSAGNKFKDACTFAFNDPISGNSTADGVLVVGALDKNGQPATPTNPRNPGDLGLGYLGRSLINLPFAGNEEGSNYGSCVDIWAPGVEIVSSFVTLNRNTAFPVGHPLYLSIQSPLDAIRPASRINYQLPIPTETASISGTSMAAPFVVGIAARLAATMSAAQLTPGGLELAVRSKALTLTSRDDAGARNVSEWWQRPPIKMASAESSPQAIFSTSTQRWATGENNDKVNIDNAPQSIIFGTGLNISLDSVGGQNCILSGYYSGNISAPESSINALIWQGQFDQRYHFGTVALSAGAHKFVSQCNSPEGLVSSARAITRVATVDPSAPIAVTWKFNNQSFSQSGQSGTVWGNSTFALAFETNAATCGLKGEIDLGYRWYEDYAPYMWDQYWQPWYEIPTFYPTFNWGGGNHLYPDRYRWTLNCSKPGHPNVVSQFHMIVKW